MPSFFLFAFRSSIDSFWKRRLCFLQTACCLLLLIVCTQGCATNGSYREEHEVSNLRVIFLDEQSLHREWETRTGREGVEFVAFKGQDLPTVRTLQGYYDFMTNTLYCPKWNFEVCGHELHHAVLGHFHEPH